jgi:predicted transposase YdaD
VTNYNVFGSVESNINFCHNFNENKGEIKDFNNTKKNTVTTKIDAKLETIPRLLQLGLTCDQISLALDLPLGLILESLKSGD